MAGHRIKITTNVLHIHGHVYSCLRAIHQNRSAKRLCGLSYGFNVYNCAQHVGHLSDCHQFGFWPHGGNHPLGIQIAIGVHIHPDELHPHALAQKVPWNDIGMMFHDRQNNFVAGL